MDEKNNETILRNANIRLCRLRSWTNYNGFGFYLTERVRPPQLICLVQSNSPAAAGGVKIWDVILAINDENVINVEYSQVIKILKKVSENNSRYINLFVVPQRSYRTLRKNNINIIPSMAIVIDTPLEMPEDYRHFRQNCPRTCHIQLQPGDRNFGFDVTRGSHYIGVYVQEVTVNSPAHRAGLRRCDRIIKINDKDVDNSKTKIIYNKLNDALIQRRITLFVMDTETYELYQSNNPNTKQKIVSDANRDASDKKPLVFVLTSNHRNELPSANESINHQTNLNCTSDYEECDIDIYVYESPDEDDDIRSNDSYIVPTRSSSNLNTLRNNKTEENQWFFDVQYELLMPFLSIEGYENQPLLSLSESVKDLEKLVPNIKRNALKAVQQCIDPWEGLTKEEFASIQLYKMERHPNQQSLFIKLNHALRTTKNQDQLIPYLPYLKLILTALWKLPSHQTIVWRGSRVDLRTQYPVGRVFVWRGFSSCVESDTYFANKDVKTLFRIECQSGKSLGHANEILLLPFSQFEVINYGTHNKNNMMMIIYLKEIQSKLAPLQSSFDTDYSVISLENEELKNFLEQHKTDTTICFSDHVVTVDDLHLIIKAIHSNKCWTFISLQRIHLNEVSIKNFMYALQLNTKIVFLELKSCQLDDHSASLIASALKTNKSLQKVDLTDNQITCAGAQSFANILKINDTLRSLHLSYNGINDSGVIALFSALKQNQKLRSLHLDRTKCTHQVIDPLLKTNLTILYLNENHLGDEGIIALSRFLEKNKQLHSLHIASNNITMIGAKEIARILEQAKNSLATLNMSNNPLQDAGVASIAQALVRNKSLIELYLDVVEMMTNGLHEIIKMIRTNGVLKVLSLKKNTVGDDEMFLFLDGLKFNDVLTQIYLNDNQLTDECITHVTNMMKNNEISQRLHVRHRSIMTTNTDT